MDKKGSFLIRMYGLVVNSKQEVLVSDEFELNMKMTKFPGGGLEFGEGLTDGLRREFREECAGQELENIRHFTLPTFTRKLSFSRIHS